ncbi:MAG TPA: Hsp33 family molecular chaperone HslO [Pseudogracilibacillus sp.]|nr:Hsp33 family molecular chaperone HslO [Pseudogracilibacillus sp.]
MSDYLIKATAYDGMVRCYVAVTTNTVEEARKRQDTWPTASAALGRSLTITAIMGAMLKGDDSLTTTIAGDGALGQVVADANAKGEVRGFVNHPHVDFPLNEQGKLDVSRAVGQGVLSVVKDQGLKDYFTGQVPIVSGEISEDFTYYFANSEQIPSAVGAGVLVAPEDHVIAAGGFILQVMPGADEFVIEQLEKSIAALPQLSHFIEEGNDAEAILKQLIPEDSLQILERMPIQFNCTCSKERMLLAIKGLGAAEIESMIKEDQGAEVTCHFCNEVYNIEETELQALL